MTLLESLDKAERRVSEAAAIRKRSITAVAKLLKAVHARHIFRLEGDILRYRRALVRASAGPPDTLVDRLQKVAEQFVPDAANNGFSRALMDLRGRGWLRRVDGDVSAPRFVTNQILAENKTYLEGFKKSFEGMSDAAIKARIMLYANYLWRASERAYRLCMQQYLDFIKNRKLKVKEGGPGSGDADHVGRPGERGGSEPSSDNAEDDWKDDAKIPDAMAGMGKDFDLAVASLKGEKIGKLAKQLKVTKKFARRYLGEGGEGSGNFGHEGRKGEVGGSTPRIGKILTASVQPTFVSKPSGVTFGLAVGHRETVKVLTDEVQKNLEKVPGQPSLDNLVFFADARLPTGERVFDSNTLGITMRASAGNETLVGFNLGQTALVGAEPLEGHSLASKVASDDPVRFAQIIADHEMGHLFFNNLNPFVGNEGRFQSGQSGWKDVYDKTGPKLRAQLSHYTAEGGYREAFAEAYAAYERGLPMPKPFKDWFDKNLQAPHLTESAEPNHENEVIGYFCGFGFGPTYHLHADGRLETVGKLKVKRG